MTRHHAFPPIADVNAKMLILGSMPGAASLLAQCYYAHPRNAFWRIMGELFSASPGLPYSQRQAILLANRVAVWDVLKSCERQGSLDSNINMETIQANDFKKFFTRHNAITTVFFNGGMAEKIYRQRVLPGLGEEFANLRYHRLPSTSPAHAGLTVPEKIAAWQVIKETIQKHTVIK